MNKVGKENIMVAFEDRFKKGYDSWQTFKNKYDTSRKKYTKFRKLTKNRTQLGLIIREGSICQMIGGVNAKMFVLLISFVYFSIKCFMFALLT